MGFDPFTNTSYWSGMGSERGRIRGLEGLEGSGDPGGPDPRTDPEVSLSIYTLARAW